MAVVNVGLGQSADDVRRWGEQLKIPFPLWLDPDRGGEAAFRTRGHPYTVLIDRAGRIVGRVPGERDWRSAGAHRLVEWLLDQK